MARPGDGGVRGRHVAILVAGGVDARGVMALHEALTGAGALPRIVALRLGVVEASIGEDLDPDATLETMPSCLFDAVALPAGAECAAALGELGQAIEFVKDQYRHCKAILAMGEGRELLRRADIPLDGEDLSLVLPAEGSERDGIEAFVAAIGRHRNWARAVDPPRV